MWQKVLSSIFLGLSAICIYNFTPIIHHAYLGLIDVLLRLVACGFPPFFFPFSLFEGVNVSGDNN